MGRPRTLDRDGIVKMAMAQMSDRCLCKASIAKAYDCSVRSVQRVLGDAIEDGRLTHHYIEPEPILNNQVMSYCILQVYWT